MAKKIKKMFRKIAIFILDTLGLASLTSCIEIAYGMPEYGTISMYGMPPSYRSVSGTVRGIDSDGDGIGERIPGIQYTYKGQKPQIIYDDEGNVIEEKTPVTDENGCFYVDLYDGEESITVTFTDIDGEENGSYKEQEVTFTFSDDKNITQDIDLEPEEK